MTLGRGSGSQEVVPLQTVAPSSERALVVCAGGDDPGVAPGDPGGVRPDGGWAATASPSRQGDP